jgi:hypothetical protein
VVRDFRYVKENDVTHQDTDRLFEAFFDVYAYANGTSDNPRATIRDMLATLRRVADARGADYGAIDRDAYTVYCEGKAGRE